MAYVNMTKDFSEVKKVIPGIGITKRQLFGFLAGALVGLPVFFFMKGPLGLDTTASVFGLACTAAPVMILVSLRKDGMYIFRKWFPVYFWVNVTFILPLRATEMLLTPKECIYRKDGKVYLRVRRTNLKKGLRTVYYDVDKDYREHSYDIPDTVVARNIEKYMELTRAQDRRFLFEYNEQMVNGLFPLASFNRLTKAFMEEYIIGNARYDFVRHASGITEFEPVTAGDSRPIAMANLYFQGSGADICRQLADHENINTSSGYYANISETIWASSLFQIQRRMDYRHRHSQELFEQGQGQMVGTGNSVCVSARRAADREDLSDCIEQGNLADCMGCRYYRPAERELQDFLDSQKMKADESARRVAGLMDKAMRIKKPGASIEEMFLSAQTEASRYRMGCNINSLSDS